MRPPFPSEIQKILFEQFLCVLKRAALIREWIHPMMPVRMTLKLASFYEFKTTYLATMDFQ